MQCMILVISLLLLFCEKCQVETLKTAALMISPDRKEKIDIDLESIRHFQHIVGDKIATQNFLLCTDDEDYIRCPVGSKVSVRSAFFGQQHHNNVCNQLQSVRIKNVTCAVSKTTEVAQQRCQDSQECHLRPLRTELSNLASSSCHGLKPYLSVSAFCQPDVQIKLLCSDAYLQIRCAESQSLEIIHARTTHRYKYDSISCVDTVKAHSKKKWCYDEDMTTPVANLCKGQKNCIVKATFPPKKVDCARTNLLLVYACVPLKQEDQMILQSRPKSKNANAIATDNKKQQDVAVNDQGGVVEKKGANWNRGENKIADTAGNQEEVGTDDDGDPSLIMFAAMAVGCCFLFVFLLLGIFLVLKKRQHPNDNGESAIEPQAANIQTVEPERMQHLLPNDPYLLQPNFQNHTMSMELPLLCSQRDMGISGGVNSSNCDVCSVHSSNLLRPLETSSSSTVSQHNTAGTVRFSQLSDLYVYQPNSQSQPGKPTKVQLQSDHVAVDGNISPSIRFCSLPSPRISSPNSDVVYTPRGVSYL